MGSFNTTCFASNQTIAPGDRARVIPVMQQGTFSRVALSTEGLSTEQHGISNSTCHPNAFWQPSAGFLPAIYDDYGLFTLVLDTDANRNAVKSFFLDISRRGAKAEQGSNECHDIPVDFNAFVAEKAPRLLALMQRADRFDEAVPASAENLDEELNDCWEYVSEAVHQHRMFVVKDRETMRPLEFAVMHEDAYQALIASVEATKNWDQLSNAREAYVRRVLAEARKRSAERHQEKKSDPTADLMADFIFSGSLSDGLNSIGNEGQFSRIALSRVIRPLAARLLKGEADDELLAEVLPHLDVRYAFSGLEMLNLTITPMIYACQDYSNELGSAYLKFVKKVNKTVSAARNSRG